jgi:hypothetical protein
MIFSQKSTRKVHLLDKTDKEHHAKSMNFISNPIPGMEENSLKEELHRGESHYHFPLSKNQKM